MSGESDYTLVKIPLITSQGGIGCGNGLVFAPHVVKPKTLGVMNATYRTLFELKAMPDVSEDDISNPVGLEDLLFYNGVSLSDGIAKLQLSGVMYANAHCAQATFKAQIEQAALQFSSVETLEVYLNGEIWDWCEYSDADPEESGCDESSKHWIVTS